MKDIYGRKIDYVRISVTDRCNLRCIYCVPECGIPSIPHEQILTYEEIEKLCMIFAELGVKKIKITGGEPLVRKNIDQLIHSIKNMNGIEEVTLTTNGILVKNQIDKLVAAGIDGINVSLDTLDTKHFAKLTRGGCVEDVLEGIESILRYPHITLKINCISNYISDDEVIEILQLAQKQCIHVRFIELMPLGDEKETGGTMNQVYNQESRIKKLVEDHYGRMYPYDEILGNGPSNYYSVEGFLGKIGFISAISHKFCEKCNRVRVTTEGHLKTCLQYDIGTHLRPLLREGENRDKIRDIIWETIQNKPKEHSFLEENISRRDHKLMSQIGG